MKDLYLIRHAKSSWKEQTLSDFDRPLNERGNKDKKTMGKRLFDKNVEVDFILSSSAKRTTQTSIALAKELNFPTQNIQFEDGLYHASVMKILAQINHVKKESNSLFVVGHNPGISMLCDYLCGHALNFPTLGIAKLTFDINDWEEVSNGTGTLEWYDYPKNS